MKYQGDLLAGGCQELLRYLLCTCATPLKSTSTFSLATQLLVVCDPLQIWQFVDPKLHALKLEKQDVLRISVLRALVCDPVQHHPLVVDDLRDPWFEGGERENHLPQVPSPVTP